MRTEFAALRGVQVPGGGESWDEIKTGHGNAYAGSNATDVDRCHEATLPLILSDGVEAHHDSSYALRFGFDESELLKSS